MRPTGTPHPRRLTVGALALTLAAALAVGGCSSSSGSDGDDEQGSPATTEAEETTTTEAEPEPADEATTLEDLESILPTLEELGEGFTEVEIEETPSYIRLAMVERCPDALAVTQEPDDAVGRAFVDAEGVQVSFVLEANAEPMTPDEEQTLVDALNDCSFGVSTSEGVNHSIEWAAGIDSIGDQAIRGAVSDSISTDEQPEPIGINTYFARVVVGDVAILIRGTDGFDGTQRITFDSDEMAPLTQEMVSRVEGLSEG